MKEEEEWDEADPGEILREFPTMQEILWVMRIHGMVREEGGETGRTSQLANSFLKTSSMAICQ